MRRDFEEYLIKVQKQRSAMLKAVEEANKLIISGEISQEQIATIQNSYNIVEGNYQRLLYCKYLLDLPPKFVQKLQEKKLLKEMEKFKAQQSDEEAVITENNDQLEITETILENKNDEE